jgi:hypothetical protein
MHRAILEAPNQQGAEQAIRAASQSATTSG